MMPKKSASSFMGAFNIIVYMRTTMIDQLQLENGLLFPSSSSNPFIPFKPVAIAFCRYKYIAVGSVVSV